MARPATGKRGTMPRRALACRVTLACRVNRLLAAGFALLAMLAATVVPGAAAGQAGRAGCRRLATLSPGEPTFDIYLYPVGDMQAMLTLKNIGYGMISSYQQLT